MVQEQFKLSAFVCLFLRKNNMLLLIRRCKTGSGDGFYSCAGGKVDGDEPMTHAMIREAREELGIKLKRKNLKMVHVLHHPKGQHGDQESVGFFMEATDWEGEPQNMEPHKHDAIGWFLLNELPLNTHPRLKHVIEMVNSNVFYSEDGWTLDRVE